MLMFARRWCCWPILATLLLANLIAAGPGWAAAWVRPGAHAARRVGHV
jgi:hypothetical protein